MKRFAIVALVFIFAMSAFTVAFAESEQIASAVVLDMNGGEVRVTVDLKDNWSVEYYPFAFYLYDHAFDPAADGAVDFQAYGTLFTKESYDSLLEGRSEGEYEEKDGCLVLQASEDTVGYYFPIDEHIYLGVIIDKAVDAESVLSRIACIIDADEA